MRKFLKKIALGAAALPLLGGVGARAQAPAPPQVAAPAEPSASSPLLYAAPPASEPSPAEKESLRARNEVLAAVLRKIEPRIAPDLLADVEIYHRAVDYVLRFPDQFYRSDYYANAGNLVKDGLARAGELEKGQSSWTEARGAVSRGYRSAVDGSIQPYCVWVPEGYDPAKPARLDVILHGRSRVLNEVSFLTSAKTGKIVGTETGRKTPPDCLKLYVFGRGNTSYRWAGESDVFEALASVRARFNVDPDRIVLRGFSMGGTGAWHLGLHFPSRWAAVEAGAGYVETRPEVLQTIHEPWRFESLAIHDASNCAINLTDLPFVAYNGSLDPIGEEHRIIRRDLEKEGYDVAGLPRALFLVGEGFGHNFRPESKRQSDAFIAASLPRRRPDNFRFVSYTPAYGEFWDFHLDSLEKLYQRAELSGTWDSVRTTNVWVLKLNAPRAITLDGQQLAGGEFYRSQGVWKAGEPGGLRKRAGLQGPIDDAFQQPFLCVEPSGGQDAVLEQFRGDFARYLHGEVRVKSPEEVTPADLADYNLVLFGDPASNLWIRRVLPGLPLHWTADEIKLDGRTFPAATDTVVMIYPNPLNPSRYVVLNTGHTFPGRDFDDMHWYLHPRLGDYAVLDKRTRAVQVAGFFDRSWRFDSASRVTGTEAPEARSAGR